MPVQVILVPTLQDNYAYLIIDEETRESAAVDPAEPKKMLEAAKKENVTISKVFTTHHHW